MQTETFSLKWVLIFFLIVSFSIPAKATDYEVWPEYPIAYEHLELHLVWNGSDAIDGRANYRIRPFRDGVEDVRLHAPNHNIQSILLDSRPVEITEEGYEIIMHLGNQNLEGGQTYTLSIVYDTKPEFGMRLGADDVLRSSLLPKSVRHWLPSFDHPRTRLSYEINVSVPAGETAIVSGTKVRSREEGDRVIWTWKSEDSVSISDIALAAGSFSMDSAMFGTKTARIFVHESQTDFEKSAGLETIINMIRRAEQAFNSEFPGDELNVVILGDEYWETKSFSKQFTFAYLNNASFEEHISRAILGQWMGVVRNTETWKDAEALAITKQQMAARHDFSFDFSVPYRYEELRISPSVYDAFSPRRAAIWTSEDSIYVNTVRNSLPDVLQLPEGLLTWKNFAEVWYASSGIPWKNPVSPLQKDIPDTLVVKVTSTVDQTNNRVVLEVSEGRAFEMELTVLTRESVQQFDISVSGSGDRIPVPVSGRILAVIPEVDQAAAIIIEEEKSLTLWLNQLRSGRLSSDQRITAAFGMASYDDDPDLQLALRDVLPMVEDDVELTAEIYRTIGLVTKGATGVQNLFLRGLESEHTSIRDASLESLQYYSGNEEIKERIFNIISGSPDIDFVNKAIPVYGRLIDEDEYESFLGQFLREDVDLEFTRTLIDELFTLENKSFAIERSEPYLSSRYPFDIRLQTLNLLMQYDDSRSRWRDRQQNLSADLDPRMRYLILEMAKKDGNNAILENRKPREFDARVLDLIGDR